MPNKNQATRRKVNRLYYQKLMATPEGRERRKDYSRRHRENNAAEIREQRIAYYERNRREIIFKERLWRMLMNVRRAVIAAGRVPFDG